MILENKLYMLHLPTQKKDKKEYTLTAFDPVF